MDKIKFPNVKVDLTKVDGNVFSIIGAVKQAMRKSGVDKADISIFHDLAFTTSDYNGVLQLCMTTVDCYGDSSDDGKEYCDNCGEELDSGGYCPECDDEDDEIEGYESDDEDEPIEDEP